MGYRGKLLEQEQARLLRAQGLPLGDIAARLEVSKSSVSLWVRDVDFVPRIDRGRHRAPNALQRRKQAEIDRLLAEGRARVGRLSEREFLMAGVALYAGEGTKRDGAVRFANSDPRMVVFSVPGCGASSRSTSPACGCAFTCTRGSTWSPPPPTGRT
jgi:hypothetical protein